MARRPWLLSLVLVSLLAACNTPPPVPIAFEQQGEAKYLRCTLRPNEQYVYSSNHLGRPASIRVGTEGKVTMFATARADLMLNNIPYQMRPATVPMAADPGAFVDKFFVDSKEELGLEAMTESRRKNVENGVWEIGMSKAEVYMAVGPPAYVDFRADATAMTFAQIMERNRWEFVEGMFALRVLLFEDGKLTRTEP